MVRTFPRSSMPIAVLLVLSLTWVPGPAAARDPVDTCYHYDDATATLDRSPCTTLEKALRIRCPVGPANCIDILVGLAQTAAGLARTGGWTVIPPAGAECDVTITPSPWVECELPSVPSCSQVDVAAAGTGSGTITVTGECAPLIAHCQAIIVGAGQCSNTASGNGNQPVACRWTTTGVVQASASCSYK